MNTVISKRNEEVQIPRKLLFACVLVIKTSVLSDVRVTSYTSQLLSHEVLFANPFRNV